MAELLAAFDEVGSEHEGMDPKEFNDDGTYKAGINQVRGVGLSRVVCQQCAG